MNRKTKADILKLIFLNNFKSAFDFIFYSILNL